MRAREQVRKYKYYYLLILKIKKNYYYYHYHYWLLLVVARVCVCVYVSCFVYVCLSRLLFSLGRIVCVAASCDCVPAVSKCRRVIKAPQKTTCPSSTIIIIMINFFLLTFAFVTCKFQVSSLFTSLYVWLCILMKFYPW